MDDSNPERCEEIPTNGGYSASATDISASDIKKLAQGLHKQVLETNDDGTSGQGIGDIPQMMAQVNCDIGKAYRLMDLMSAKLDELLASADEQLKVISEMQPAGGNIAGRKGNGGGDEAEEEEEEVTRSCGGSNDEGKGAAQGSREETAVMF
ncbi:hypothetical protein EV182_003880 [Spiromyces aspiralis]|uniref:Uncharacterized protein n=1 Tax=Spiromyces aspiralis TaxID=68401 RepID=A0ACC1HTF1_9FUNG|nr:hypothetical protein EV182_003880 [Spiromyces aspiralis]